jgi:hypothetical protein
LVPRLTLDLICWLDDVVMDDGVIGRTTSRYRVLAPLGSGGMGVVFRGEDTSLGRPVAIKMLPPEISDRPQAVERLRREARAASQLKPRIAAPLGGARPAPARRQGPPRSSTTINAPP